MATHSAVPSIVAFANSTVLVTFCCRFLESFRIFLARGFDASATIQKQSSLHMALWRGHEKSAFALVRAGADIYQTVPKSLAPEEGDEDVVTALEACRELLGDKTASLLELAAST
jgi:hypothetical protein